NTMLRHHLPTHRKNPLTPFILMNGCGCVDGAEQPSDKIVNTMSHNERNRRASANMADRQNQSLYPPCTRRTMWVAIILLVVIVAAGVWAFYSILG
ncbi:hypothetical protein, partial [Paramuribaculum intestinale]|uniref:hypothetical protein n=2 Tax=Paramuribaculum intestinale TaxID=2094151 RepID=UPI0025B09314